MILVIIAIIVIIIIIMIVIIMIVIIVVVVVVVVIIIIIIFLPQYASSLPPSLPPSLSTHRILLARLCSGADPLGGAERSKFEQSKSHWIKWDWYNLLVKLCKLNRSMAMGLLYSTCFFANLPLGSMYP